MAESVNSVYRGLAALFDREPKRPLLLGLLICLHLVICAASLRVSFPYYRSEYVMYDPAGLASAIVATAIFSLIAPLFVFARFSFGYLCGFYLFTMVAGFLWLTAYSKLQYDHVAASISAGLSCLTFLLPALFITSRIGRSTEISERSFERILYLIVAFCLATSIVAATYGFRITAINDIYRYRSELQFPTALNYAIASTMTVLLPFAYACFALRRRYWLAAAMLAISISFYPSTLSKIALFTPAWLLFMTLLSILLGRFATILSLFLPVLTGVLFISTIGEPLRRYFDIVNARMLSVPSVALDVYNEYFAQHELTHFCQIWLLKPFMSCVLKQPLSVEMNSIYPLGFLNASLFATEGIASVGVWGAPLATLACGLVVGFGNRLSAGLSERFVLISAAIVPQVITNVPFSTLMLTHGLWLLFLLWYVTPRTLFGGPAEH
ncbi:hypothetical protein [Bradyrhizobium sp. SEMIA]|uniref:hypothetical protein n=1 Tax=Bradyrhizobium sp. SEMIA TaxID=2597515 RepID=UPI0018A53B2A|nr:hypothetical protein [Bradyrhizobium sp. SEMIA]QOG17174.1 hypothetical protein FOM02_07270 [Bradyrhizobium sp. SEMIA]